MADDIYTIDALATGSETITITDDGTGSDWLVYSGSYASYAEIDLSWFVDSGISQSAEGLYFTVTGGHRLVINGLIENARGTTAEDWISGNEADNLLYGDFDATGAGGNDTINGDAGRDTIYGGSGLDSLEGSYDDDLLHGDGGADTVSGGAGNDTVLGGEGADWLYGGADARDVVSYADSTDGVYIEITYGSTTIATSGFAEGDHLNGFTDAIGSAYGDRITDTVVNTIAFGYNANRFYGGGGADLLNMGGGNDSGYGGDGRDSVNGGVGDDLLFGGGGNDDVDGGTGADVVYGGDGYNRLIGGAGQDRVIGGGLRETLYGGAGDDTLLAGGGNDLLFANEGNDRVLGGAGDDLLFGLAGKDTLIGGAGADEFRFISATDGGSDAASRDVVMDFNRSQGDHLVFSIAAASLDFIGQQSFTGQAGEVRFIVTAQGTRAFADLDGDRITDQAFDVLGVSLLQESDFVL
ncbi:calcium-binding protein [Tabrizicola oligotrophica]|uniref:Calcium-binding protein n=1 Tax=Tabrizicola oligotrophica TaxID=2710650 RepID=A0A6M0QU38_9RHOB|nr:calcium-binding protein [Tabrizicola oligotrophica]NEY91006.1 calcium-binding protein [Tabrizicola oligotrophica]